MSAGSDSNHQPLMNNTDRVFTADVERRRGWNQSDACPKSPLLLMCPQETRPLSVGSQTERPWVETPFTVPQGEVWTSSPTVPFSLQEYLNDQNGLERCIAGMPQESQCSSSPERERHTRQQAVQVDTHAPSPAVVADSAANTGFSDSDYVQVDYAEMVSVGDYEAAAAADDSGDMDENEVLSLDSASAVCGGPLAASSSPSHSSGYSVVDPSHALLSNALRYESLHRQLQEAGLAGLGDGTNSIQMYHR